MEVEIDVFLVRDRPQDQWPGMRAMGTRLLYSEHLPNGEELVVTSFVGLVSEERRERLEEDKAVALAAQRDVLRAASQDGANLRAAMLTIPRTAGDMEGAPGFVDVLVPTVA